MYSQSWQSIACRLSFFVFFKGLNMKFANMRRAFATSGVLLDKWYLNYVSAQASLQKWSELQIQFILGWIILRQFKLLVLHLLYKQCLLFLKDFLYAICKTLKNHKNLFSVETRILQNSQLTLCEVTSIPLVINAAYTYNLHLTPYERDWYFRCSYQKCNSVQADASLVSIVSFLFCFKSFWWIFLTASRIISSIQSPCCCLGPCNKFPFLCC